MNVALAIVLGIIGGGLLAGAALVYSWTLAFIRLLER